MAAFCHCLTGCTQPAHNRPAEQTAADEVSHIQDPHNGMARFGAFFLLDARDRCFRHLSKKIVISTAIVRFGYGFNKRRRRDELA
jgi:hypothetical protein